MRRGHHALRSSNNPPWLQACRGNDGGAAHRRQCECAPHAAVAWAPEGVGSPPDTHCDPEMPLRRSVAAGASLPLASEDSSGATPSRPRSKAKSDTAIPKPVPNKCRSRRQIPLATSRLPPALEALAFQPSSKGSSSFSTPLFLTGRLASRERLWRGHEKRKICLILLNFYFRKEVETKEQVNTADKKGGQRRRGTAAWLLVLQYLRRSPARRRVPRSCSTAPLEPGGGDADGVHAGCAASAAG